MFKFVSADAAVGWWKLWGIRRKLTALVADSSDFVAECFLQGVLLWSTMQWQSFFFTHSAANPLRSKPTAGVDAMHS